MKEGKIIKLITRRELDALIKMGQINPSTMEGVAVTSKKKSSKAKHYYVEDTKAFIAWRALGLNPDDKDFKKWKSKEYAKRKKNKKFYKKRER